MQTQMAEMSAATAAWTFDPEHTLVEFTAKHMMITTVRGRFHDVTGTVLLDERNPLASIVDVRIAAASLDTGIGARDDHLRSADFLDVENHPYVRFQSRSIDGSYRSPGERFVLMGDLTIRGVTRQVPLRVTYEGEGVDPDGIEKMSFSAETRIDRRDFGLLWNLALETGGVLVSNEVRISLQVQLMRSADTP